MQDGNNMEFRVLYSYNSGTKQIVDVKTGWLYISHGGNRKCKEVPSVPHKKRQIILVINTAYTYSQKIVIRPLASILLGEINVD
jgi:hypothetical protein